MRPQPIYINAEEFHRRTGMTKMQAKRFRELNKDKGLYKQTESGRFIYNINKIPQQLIKAS